MKRLIKIGNAQAFWGDRNEAAAELLRQEPALDYITLDYLSEVSLSIMAVQREKDPSMGYAKDFVDVVSSLIPFWQEGSKVKVIANAGGLDPMRCAKACEEVLGKAKLPLKIGVVTGDDVLPLVKSHPDNPLFNHLEAAKPVQEILNTLTTANAYLGAKGIVEALKKGADIVITGRIADPSMAVAPCVAEFDWKWNDYQKLAQATVAGHIIECGTQVTGGISDQWLSLNEEEIGFPIVEIDNAGKVIVTKGNGSGGSVTVETVKEQLLYEIGDPSAYLSPDATVSFLTLKVSQESPNRVAVLGATGSAPPPTLKVSATFRDGYKAEGTLAIFGKECRSKAERSGEIILKRMERAGFTPAKALVECIGCGAIVPGVVPFGSDKNQREEPLECLLRVCVADPRRETVDYFSRQMAPMVTSGAPGTTGYTTGRPTVRPVFGYWPCLIEANAVSPKVTMLGGA